MHGAMFAHTTDKKMAGETPEVRSDKRKQREERGEREKKRDIEKNREGKERNREI